MKRNDDDCRNEPWLSRVLNLKGSALILNKPKEKKNETFYFTALFLTRFSRARAQKKKEYLQVPSNWNTWKVSGTEPFARHTSVAV